MTPEHSIPARLVRAGAVCACFCAVALSTNVSRASMSSWGATNSWQWHGFSRSSWVPVLISGSETYVGSAFSLSEASTVDTTVSGAMYSTVSADAGSASLSGAVFFDSDPADGIRNSDDWGIGEASVMLTLNGSSATPWVALTDQYGCYSFTGLAAGDYTLFLMTSGEDPEEPNVGGITDSLGHDIFTGRGTATDLVTIAEIHLGDGYKAVDYDFPQLDYPAQLLSKRMVLNSRLGPSNTDPATPVVIPEPSSLMLLVMAGLVFGGVYWRRRMG